MDRKRNALMDYTTADILNTPIRRGGILPVTEYADRSEFDMTSGLPGAFWNALMAPARAYRGELPEGQQIPEAFNFAGSLTLGNLLSGAAAPVKARAMSAYKALGPEDASPSQLMTLRRNDVPSYNVSDDYGSGWYQFDNKSPRGMLPEALFDDVIDNTANYNNILAANAKTGAAVPLLQLLLGNDEGPIY